MLSRWRVICKLVFSKPRTRSSIYKMERENRNGRRKPARQNLQYLVNEDARVLRELLVRVSQEPIQRCDARVCRCRVKKLHRIHVCQRERCNIYVCVYVWCNALKQFQSLEATFILYNDTCYTITWEDEYWRLCGFRNSKVWLNKKFRVIYRCWI